jgi:hypothetical protein
MLTIRAHSLRGYGPRTRFNANAATLTVAFAHDFNTAGERLTRSAAGDRYLAVPLLSDSVEASRRLFVALRPFAHRVLNVAGNGLHSLARQDIKQEAVNAWVLDVIERVHRHLPLHQIVCGGQTGVDIAGAIAGQVLGIDTCVTLPPGFQQRHADGLDVCHTELEIRGQIEAGAEALSARAESAESEPAQDLTP